MLKFAKIEKSSAIGIIISALQFVGINNLVDIDW